MTGLFPPPPLNPGIAGHLVMPSRRGPAQLWRALALIIPVVSSQTVGTQTQDSAGRQRAAYERLSTRSLVTSRLFVLLIHYSSETMDIPRAQFQVRVSSVHTLTASVCSLSTSTYSYSLSLDPLSLLLKKHSPIPLAVHRKCHRRAPSPSPLLYYRSQFALPSIPSALL